MTALRDGAAPAQPRKETPARVPSPAMPSPPGRPSDVITLARPAGQHPGGQRPGEVTAAPDSEHHSGLVHLLASAYPGMPGQVRRARTDLAEALHGCPAAEDTLLCLAEIAANAVIHSRSGAPGGHFTVRASARPGQYVQVTVDDGGGPWHNHHPGHGAEHGHGLRIVRALSAQMGITGDDSGRTVWFRCPWHPA